jgi:hypothetical protein
LRDDFAIPRYLGFNPLPFFRQRTAKYRLRIQPKEFRGLPDGGHREIFAGCRTKVIGGQDIGYRWIDQQPGQFGHMKYGGKQQTEYNDNIPAGENSIRKTAIS